MVDLETCTPRRVQTCDNESRFGLPHVLFGLFIINSGKIEQSQLFRTVN
jgi:hypothetical protein